MKIIGIEHIGIATDDLSKGKNFWNQILNITHTPKPKQLIGTEQETL